MTKENKITPKNDLNSEKKTNECCGGSPKSREDACCIADEKAKDKGQEGCGCSCSTSN
ncbi:hypothetical protein [Kiloniella antarctica]|uniref:Metallothionein n=1 Tax=Kiloniella antarctica TaxID=1550907 RepID=A0ABW5BNY1_9PROT